MEQIIDKTEGDSSRKTTSLFAFFIFGILACLAAFGYVFFLEAYDTGGEFAPLFFLPVLVSLTATVVLLIVGLVLQKNLLRRWKSTAGFSIKIINVIGMIPYFLAFGYVFMFLTCWRQI